jgi:hypothetical protein
MMFFLNSPHQVSAINDAATAQPATASSPPVPASAAAPAPAVPATIGGADDAVLRSGVPSIDPGAIGRVMPR